MAGDHLLSIDVGTQSVRALLFDLRGNLLAGTRVLVEPYFSAKPGWLEQDPTYFWSLMCRACRQLWASTPHTASTWR